MPLTKEEKYARARAYKATPEFKAHRIAYDKKRWENPEVREAARLRRQTPEYKAKQKVNNKKYRSTEEYKIWKRAYRKLPEQQTKRRDYEFNKKFGITTFEYNQMLEEQGGVCAICHQKETFTMKGVTHSLAIDHDHLTGRVRGLLCRACNQTLGLMKDNIENLQKAIRYLEKK